MMPKSLTDQVAVIGGLSIYNWILCSIGIVSKN